MPFYVSSIRCLALAASVFLFGCSVVQNESATNNQINSVQQLQGDWRGVLSSSSGFDQVLRMRISPELQGELLIYSLLQTQRNQTPGRFVFAEHDIIQHDGFWEIEVTSVAYPDFSRVRLVLAPTMTGSLRGFRMVDIHSEGRVLSRQSQVELIRNQSD
ncbi:MAG: hypothetical protein LAT66_03380 [Alkalimonas sp.]|nr:hypothetical protein [Alkalimonas sp.]